MTGLRPVDRVTPDLPSIPTSRCKWSKNPVCHVVETLGPPVGTRAERVLLQFVGRVE